MGLAKFALKRTVALVVVVVVAVSGTFLSVHVLRPNRFPDDSRPLPVQLADYLQRALLHFDFGRSWSSSQRPVADLIRDGLPADLWLLGGAVAFGVVVGIAGGAICAANPGSLLARLLQAGGLFFLCAPVYVVGMAMLLMLGSGIAVVHVGFEIPTRYVPMSQSPGRWLGALVVPWIVLGLPLAALCLRMM